MAKTEINSGYINQIQPREQRRIIDSRTGSYPTISRIGTSDFKGNYNTYFNDTNTLIFTGSHRIRAGVGLMTGTVYSRQLVGNTHTSFVHTGTVFSGLFNEYYDVGQPNGESITPFVEDGLYVGYGANVSGSYYVFPDYASGSESLTSTPEYLEWLNNNFTNPTTTIQDMRIGQPQAYFQTSSARTEVGPGFSTPLSSKVRIEIDINPSESTDIFWSTGSTPNTIYPNEIGSGIAYYNFSLKRWEMIGITRGGITTGSHVDYINRETRILSQSTLAFAPFNPLNRVRFPESEPALALQSGRVTSAAGFPFASQFDATGSQLLDMSQHINKPFLVEKIEIVYSGTSHRYGGLGNFRNFAAWTPIVQNFFLLNQFNYGLNVSQSFEQITGRNYNNNTNVSQKAYHNVTKLKDIVSIGYVSKYKYGYEVEGSAYIPIPASGSTKYHTRDLDIVNHGYAADDWDILNSQTGSFRVSFPARIPTKNTTLTYLQKRTTYARSTTLTPAESYLISNEFGGRTGLAFNTGRGLKASFPSIQPSGTYHISGSTGWVGIRPELGTHDVVSPYILMPKDKLILGFANQGIAPTTDFTYDATVAAPGGGGSAQLTFDGEELHRTMFRQKFSPGEGKLILYGTLVQDGQEVQEPYNQPLTSKAIHEALTYDNTVIDQWDVEHSSQFNGTYIDQVFSGSIYDSGSTNARTVAGTVSGGTVGTTGSLMRGIKLIDSKETYYDTLMPNPVGFHQTNGFSVYKPEVGAIAYLTVGNPFDEFPGSEANTVDKLWPMSFPFEPKYNELKRLHNSIQFKKDLYTCIDNTGAVVGKFPVEALLLSSSEYSVGATSTSLLVSSVDKNELNPAKYLDPTMFLKAYFAFGGGAGGRMPDSNKIHEPVSDVGVGLPVWRGWKYGILNPVNLRTNAIYRYDRYGQLRDMLEPRQYSTIYTNDAEGISITRPIKIVFLDSDGEETSAKNTTIQNLSQFATSSLPYFDGEIKDRVSDPVLNRVYIELE